MATPVSETPPVEKTVETRATEDVAVSQTESSEADESAPAVDKKTETADVPTTAAVPSAVDEVEPSDETPVVESEAPAAKKAPVKSKVKAFAPAAAADSAMTLVKTLIGPAELKPGQTVTYELLLGCTSITTPCTDAVLMDQLPAPLVLKDITYIGFAADVDKTITADNTHIELKFNEQTNDVSGVGLNDGTDYTVTITATLPLDASPELGGTALTNSATLTSKAGDAEDDAEPVTIVIDAAPKAEVTKSWAKDNLLEGSTTENNVTLGGIKNASKVGATSLTILEPSGDHDPFASVEFTGFGETVFPEGADKIQVNYFVGKTKVVGTPGAPNAPPALPGDVNLSTITGFEFIFTSSTSTDSKGGIVASGSAGSIELNTNLRADAKHGNVTNEVSITAQTPKGDSDPSTAKDSFVIDATDYKVNATKAFSEKTVVAGDAATIGEDNKRSTVTIGATNASNQPLKTLSIKEPAEGTAPFGAGIDFEKFVSGTWPTGANSGEIVVGGTSYSLSNNGGNLEFPAELLALADIKAFEIKFAGEFAPQTGFNLKFDVLGTDLGSFENLIIASGETGIGGEPATDEATATITVVDPKQKLIGDKRFDPATVEGIVGDKVTATLNTKVDGSENTNVDVREIEQTDMFTGMVPNWKPTTVTVAANQGASSVLVQYQNAAGTWDTLISNAVVNTSYDLPADSQGVRITYKRDSGTFLAWNDVSAKIGFEVVAVAAEGTKFENVLGINNGDDTKNTVTVDKELKLSSTKRWEQPTIVQKPNSQAKPSNMNPTSILKLSAVNTSTFPVDSLTLVDPKANETNPFDYVNITAFTATLRARVNPATANLTVNYVGGGTDSFSGADALNPVLPEGKNWSEVVGFEFELLPTAEHKVIRGAGFDLSVTTALRDNLRTDGSTDIDVALAALVPKYTIPNTATSTIKRAGDDDFSKDEPAALKVITKNSVDIKPVLTKSFNPTGPGTFFTKNGVPSPIEVGLTLKTGTDKADKIVLEDTDPTFWNAFDFVKWTGFQSGPNNAKMKYEFLTGATFTNAADGTVNVDGGTWTTRENLSTNINSLLGEYSAEAPMTGIQGFRITVQTDDYAELTRTDNVFKFSVLPRYTLRTGELNGIDGKTVNPGEAKNSTVENTASAKAERLSQDHQVKDFSAEYQFTPGTNEAAVTKTSDVEGGKIASGREVNYTITVSNPGTEVILDPIIVDKLPQDKDGLLLELDPEWVSTLTYDLAEKFAQAPAGSEMTTDPELVKAEMVNKNEVTFTFPEGTKLYPGESYTIVLPVKIRAGVVAGTDLTNNVEFGGEETTPGKADSNLAIIEGQAYASQKLVREVPSDGDDPTGVHNTVNDAACFQFEGGFYRYPCAVETKPGGIAEWKLSVTNTGNVPSQHMEILDIFPYVGDTGVTSTQAGKARESQWSPTLLNVELPVVPEGTKMVLSYLTGDPATCKPNGKDISDPWDGCTTNWTTDRPANPKEIHGIKLVMDFPKGLAPKDSVSLKFTTQSATEMPKDVGALAPAWNSFGYAAQALVNEKIDYRSQEPIKSGITFSPVEREKVSVGDYVWLDANKDGIQDEDEIGIKDVTLKLTDQDGNPVTDVYGNEVLPTMTDGEGWYEFANLPVLEVGQKYVVSIDKEASKEVLKPYLPTKANIGDKDKDSSGWVAETDPSAELLKNDGDHDPTLDFGFFLNPGKVSVGDYVWVDTDRDGRQDEKEPGIPGVVLELTGPDDLPVTDVFGEPVGSVTTGDNGEYLFENLPVLKDGESYTVTIKRDDDSTKKALAPYVPTESKKGDREGDSSKESATSEGLTSDGDHDPTLDFGFVLPKVSVGDYVWVDTDRDGTQGDPKDEPGIEGVVLILVGPNGDPVTDVFGKPVDPTTTDKDGKYTFENLPVLKTDESYTVTIKQDDESTKKALAPYVPTIETDDSRENDSSTWESKSEGLTNDGDHDPTLDFGFVLPKVSVGDYVWVDTDRDGTQGDPKDEPGIEGVVLILVGPNGDPVTDVFGKPVDPTTTDKDGKYTFENLPVLEDGQSYTVTIDKEASAEPLAPYIPTIVIEGDRKNDSSEWTESSEGLTSDGDHDPTLDFGFVLPKVSVGDYVWVDTDRDGTQGDPKDEPGIEGVVLILVGPNGDPVTDVFGKPVDPTTTDKDGKYTFENLPVLEDGQSYTVTIDKEASAEPLAPYIPTIETDDSRENDSSTWESKSEGLTNDGEHDPTLDFGFVLPKVSVGDYVWVDTDRDGRQDEGEPGIHGVVLELTGPDGEPVVDINGDPVGPVTTGDMGEYLFNNLPVLKDGESYKVTIKQDDESTKNALAPYIPTKQNEGDRDFDSSTWAAKSEGLTKNDEHDPTLDFGFVLPKVSVGDYVWVDTDRDGRQGENEPGIHGVVLELTGPDGEPVVDINGKPVGPVTTGENGEYLFGDLPVLEDGKSYTVTIDQEKSKEALKPYVPTKSGEGDREGDSSDGSATSEGLTNDGDHDPTLDFGFVLKPEPVDPSPTEPTTPVEPTEPTVEPTKPPTEPTTPVEPTEPPVESTKPPTEPTTPVEPTEPTVEPTKPPVESTKPPVESTTPVEPTEPTVEPTKPPVESSKPTEPKVSLGDYVWVDENGDGRRDEGEPGIPGVVLELTGPDGKPVLDINGDPVGPVTTDKNGKYVFVDLPVLEDGQTYTVTINREKSKEVLAPYVPTKSGQGDREDDSSEWTATSEGLSKDGEHDPTLDFGFVLIQEPSEPATPEESSESDDSIDPTESSDPAAPSESSLTESSDPVVPGESSDKGKDTGEGLASTGFTALSAAIGGLLLLLVGFLLVRARTTRKHG